MFSVYFKELTKFESVCSCCRVTDYQPLVVELYCEDQTTFKKELDVPSECSCKSCASQCSNQTKSPTKTFTKTKNGRKHDEDGRPELV